MVNWPLIGRSFARYSAGYGGGATLAILLAFRNEMLLLLVVLAGFVSLLYSAGSDAKPAPTGNAAERDSIAVSMGAAAAGSAPVAKAQPSNLKALFVGLGLIVFGIVAMMAVPYL